MAQSSKFKFLYALKLNFNGGQFYKEIHIIEERDGSDGKAEDPGLKDLGFNPQ